MVVTAPKTPEEYTGRFNNIMKLTLDKIHDSASTNLKPDDQGDLFSLIKSLPQNILDYRKHLFDQYNFEKRYRITQVVSLGLLFIGRRLTTRLFYIMASGYYICPELY